MNWILSFIKIFVFFHIFQSIYVSDNFFGITPYGSKSYISAKNSKLDKSISSSNFSNLDIREYSSNFYGAAFLYTIMPKTKRIGVLSYDVLNTINRSKSKIDYDKLKIVECGNREGFISRPSVYNINDLIGYDSAYMSFAYACRAAQNNEFKWFDGTSLGVPIWFSRSLNGDLQCYSVDGENCVWKGNNAKKISIESSQDLRSLNESPYKLTEYLSVYDEVEIKTRNDSLLYDLILPRIQLPAFSEQGKRISVKVNSDSYMKIHFLDGTERELNGGSQKSWIYVGNEWYEEGKNINEYPAILEIANPVTCGFSDRNDLNKINLLSDKEWCGRIINPDKTYSKMTLQSMVDSKINHMDRLFAQMRDYELQKINEEYNSHLEKLSRLVDATEVERDFICKGFWWSLPGILACPIVSSEYNDLFHMENSLRKTKKAKVDAVIEKIEIGRQTELHKLHEEWALGDSNRYVALLKEESEALSELEKLKSEHEKTIDQSQAAYLQAVQNFYSNHSFKGVIVSSLESLPLVGREIKNIIKYSENPSSENLRKVMLGIIGPPGEFLEGAFEFSEGKIGLDSGAVEFIADVLTDIVNDHKSGEVLEDIVADTINGLGDEAVESVREAGLWRDNSNEENTIYSEYESVVHLRSDMDIVEYNFWNGSIDAEVNVKRKFTISDYNNQRIIGSSNYTEYSVEDIFSSIEASKFDNNLSIIFSHAFGQRYWSIVESSERYKNYTQAQVNYELYKVIAHELYNEQRKPRWVDSKIIGHRPAAFIYNDKHSFIALNRDLVKLGSDDFYKFYFEELGHMVNWWRCRLFDVNISHCQSIGDVGARFRDAVLIDDAYYDEPLETLLVNLPKHQNVDSNLIKFKNGNLATLEGWPDIYKLNESISGGGDFNFLMRFGVDIQNSEFPNFSDELALDVTLTAPKPAPKGNPWGRSKGKGNYCKTDNQLDCDMPTVWLSIAFRDAMKISPAKIPQLKNTKLIQKTGFDMSPRLVRKHGGKLPFQLTSVSGTDWKYFSQHNIYYKKFSAALESKIDLLKSLSGVGFIKKIAKKISSFQFLLKSTAISGSYLVEIPISKAPNDFKAWLAADISTQVLGCVGGVVLDFFIEQDPIMMCNGFSDYVEGVETLVQGIDKIPTKILESDSNISLPSIEYKYVGTQRPVNEGGVSYNRESRCISIEHSGRDCMSTYTQDPSGVDVRIRDHSRYVPNMEAEAKSIQGRASRFVSRFGRSNFQLPMLAFRFRISVTSSEKVVDKGKYNLPAVVISD